VHLAALSSSDRSSGPPVRWRAANCRAAPPVPHDGSRTRARRRGAEPPSMPTGRAHERRRGPPVRWRAAHRRRYCTAYRWCSLDTPLCVAARQAVPNRLGDSALRRARPPVVRVWPAQPCPQAEAQQPASPAVALRLGRTLCARGLPERSLSCVVFDGRCPCSCARSWRADA